MGSPKPKQTRTLSSSATSKAWSLLSSAARACSMAPPAAAPGGATALSALLLLLLLLARLLLSVAALSPVPSAACPPPPHYYCGPRAHNTPRASSTRCLLSEAPAPGGPCLVWMRECPVSPPPHACPSAPRPPIRIALIAGAEEAARRRPKRPCTAAAGVCCGACACFGRRRFETGWRGVAAESRSIAALRAVNRGIRRPACISFGG